MYHVYHVHYHPPQEIKVKKYATNITLIVILCLNESVSRLIRLRYRNFIRDATKNLKINKKKEKSIIIS